MERANHFEVSGKGISGVIDTVGLDGEPAVSLHVDGHSIDDAALEVSGEFGIEVMAFIEAAPDHHVTHLQMLLPEVNVDDEPVTFAGVAIIATGLTTIGGPALVRGTLNQYEVRPVAGTASAIRT